MQIMLFIYILHSLNLAKGLDNTMIVPYGRKYSSGSLLLCVFTHIYRYFSCKMHKEMQYRNRKTSEVMQHMETVNYPNS